MARWVFPVLVGPSTAVTPAPRARRARSAGGENEIGIKVPAFTRHCAVWRALLYHNVTRNISVLKMWNESGTNRGRIGDSQTVRFRSPRYMASLLHMNTKSGRICDSKPPPWRQKC